MVELLLSPGADVNAQGGDYGNALASPYRNQGRCKEAEELQAQVLEIFSKVLGTEHPDTLTSMAKLASTAIATRTPRLCGQLVSLHSSEKTTK